MTLLPHGSGAQCMSARARVTAFPRFGPQDLLTRRRLPADCFNSGPGPGPEHHSDVLRLPGLTDLTALPKGAPSGRRSSFRTRGSRVRVSPFATRTSPTSATASGESRCLCESIFDMVGPANGPPPTWPTGWGSAKSSVSGLELPHSQNPILPAVPDRHAGTCDGWRSRPDFRAFRPTHARPGARRVPGALRSGAAKWHFPSRASSY